MNVILRLRQRGVSVRELAAIALQYGKVILRSWRLALSGATLAWMGLIFYLSSLSQDEVPTASWLGAWQSYLGHIFLYGVLAALTELSLWGWNSGYQIRWVLIAAVAATLYGVSDEFHQSFVAGRTATIKDVLVDTAAAIAASAILWLVATHWKRYA